ncbi:hypothetical protein [Granulicella aggregans]|uniref:hypothetical protein n=1 Tax=Granulicella aggregans TaxID=474949 RepID=UPI0021E04FFB|nr:hypothetical protein [Granulicella aggregans]
MHPVVRSIGKVLRLVGISSPEDSEVKKTSAADPPSWKTAKPPAEETKPNK